MIGGSASAEARDLLHTLARRGIRVDPETEARILGTSDPDTIRRWAARAASATCLEDVLGDMSMLA